MPYASLVGWGHYAPDNVVTNDDLAKIVDTSDEWIQSRSGIRERHFAEEGQPTSDLCIHASRDALDVAGLTAADLDLILIATSSPDYLVPPVSSIVQHELGAECGAMTLQVGCTGFVYGLVTAQQFIETGAYRTVLLVGAETISSYMDMTDRTTCVLFGDGAGAVVLQATETPCGMRAFELGSDGSGAEAIIAPSPGSKHPVSQKVVDERMHYLRMNGREVFKFATRTMGASLGRVMEEAGMTADDIDLFIPHQANARIIEYAAKEFGLPDEKVVVNVDRYGNTSAASIPIALSEALSDGRAKPGDTLAMVGFGSGLTWAASIFTLGSMRAEAAASGAAASGATPSGAAASPEAHDGDGAAVATPDSVIGTDGEVRGLIA